MHIPTGEANMRIPVAAIVFLSLTAAVQASEFSAPWQDPANAIVLDPFQGNRIDWEKVKTDPRVAVVIHKASQGLQRDGKYAQRRDRGKELGYLWGSYHLLTTADVAGQIDNYLATAGQEATETHAVDVECLSTSSTCQSPSFKVTFGTIEAALRTYKQKTGRFPLLYVNDSTARTIAQRWGRNTEFEGVRLWYARFKTNITDAFPLGAWKSYRLWQFSSEINCSAASCPYRVPGTDPDMDVNVYFGSPDELRKNWPLEK
jgi:GH25 family lysozyme M1 (1,4-beta-N-acetylmuramidase)